MGGNQVYGPQLPGMPAELGGARKSTWDYIFEGINNPATSPFGFDYNPTAATSKTGGILNYLTGPNQMTAGGPQQISGGGAPGSGLPLDSLMPLPSAYGKTGSMLDEALSTGFLGDTSALWGAKKNLYNQNLADTQKQAWQTNFLEGGRVGTGIANLIGENANRAGIGLAAEMAPYDYQNINAAADRRLQAGNLGLGMSQFLENLIMGRTGALGAFGQQEFGNKEAMRRQAYEDWLRKQVGYNPAGNMALNYSMGYPFSAQTPTVVPPWWQDILGGAISGGAGVAAASIMND